MKLKWTVFYVLICIVTFFGGIYAGMRYENKNVQRTVSADRQEEIVQTENQIVLDVAQEEDEEPLQIIEESFILYATDSGINLYKLKSSGETEFISEYEADLASLPSADYQSLCKGISVKSREEALRLIEDFIS